MVVDILTDAKPVMEKVLKENKMDKRLFLKEITTCKECPNFEDNRHYYGYGSARYSCTHLYGPDGELSEEIVRDRTIHPDCPLVKAGDD